MRPRHHIALVRVVALSVISMACTGPVQVKRVGPPKPPSREEMFDVGALSEATLAILDRHGLTDRLEESPAAVLAILNGLESTSGDRDLLSAQAELLDLAASRVESVSREQAGAWTLLAASRAYDFLYSDSDSLPRLNEREGRAAQMQEIYGRSVGSYLAYLKESGRGLNSHGLVSAFESFDVRIDIGPDTLDPAQCDEVLVSRNLEIRGLRNHYVRRGVGAPLVELRENHGQTLEDLFLPTGVVSPATAVIRFGEPTGEPGERVRAATITFYDPRKVASVEVGAFRVSLAADFTSAYAYMASLPDVLEYRRTSFLEPEELQAFEGIYLLEPYDPQKIPILMVHGMGSSPLAWLELTNDIFGNGRFRDRYQVWNYAYPTGLTYLQSGATLRRRMAELQAVLDPEGDDPAMNSVVVVAHSLGGLVTRTLVTESGLDLWNAAIQIPPGQVVGSEEDVQWLENLFIWSPVAWIDRVIFVAVPHRGVDTAIGPMGRISSSLVDLPDQLIERIQALVDANPRAIREETRELVEEDGPTSVQSIRSDSPVLQALAQLPVDERILFHTIVGGRGRPFSDIPSDGWVPHASSFLEGAESQVVVPAGHSVYEHPAAIAEIERILELHLSETRGSQAQDDSGGEDG